MTQRSTHETGQDLAYIWRGRPTGGTPRERQAWENGFREAAEALAPSAWKALEMGPAREYIDASEGADAIVCPCGNQTHTDGFFTCTAEGVEVEPTPEAWDGIHAYCAACGRIFREDTFVVVGRRVGVGPLLDTDEFGGVRSTTARPPVGALADEAEGWNR